MHAYLKLHTQKLLSIFLVLNGLLLLSLMLGDVKAWKEIDWLDILGEGGAALVTLIWIGFLLNSRPQGRVTNILTLALTFIFIALWQDALDEVIRLPESAALLDGMLESIPMPVGMLLLTFGLYHWHREQLAINEQLLKRERVFREHTTIDPVTQLASAAYLKEQLRRELTAHAEQQQPLSLLMLDIDYFAQLNRDYGPEEGDRMLQQIAELLLLNLRRCDLLCRYAGDRFAILLPNTGSETARSMAGQLNAAVCHFAFKTSVGETVYRNLTIVDCLAGKESPEDLLTRANRLLEQKKEQRDRQLRVA